MSDRSPYVSPQAMVQEADRLMSSGRRLKANEEHDAAEAVEEVAQHLYEEAEEWAKELRDKK